MKKYLSFFRLKFIMELQYRAAAFGGIVTQFVWGTMEILVYKAFYKADALAFPMEFSSLASYIWLQQALLALFMVWFMENEIFDCIKNGDIIYEICRPVKIYDMWFSRSIANRLSKAFLRCIPIIAIAVFLPKPYGISLPKNFITFILFLVTLMLGVLVTVSFCMIIYMTTFFTISPMGIRMISITLVEFFSGAVIPLPFFPDKLKNLMELLPFASMGNVPFRVYSNNIYGKEVIRVIILQIFWIIIMTMIGKFLEYKVMKRVVVQGG